MGRSPLLQVTSVPSLAAIGTVEIVLGCHMVLQEHVTKGSCDLMERAHQAKLQSCQVSWL